MNWCCISWSSCNTRYSRYWFMISMKIWTRLWRLIWIWCRSWWWWIWDSWWCCWWCTENLIDLKKNNFEYWNWNYLSLIWAFVNSLVDDKSRKSIELNSSLSRSKSRSISYFRLKIILKKKIFIICLNVKKV